jgi:diguanylate cyclase (GGDEF)-like protein
LKNSPVKNSKSKKSIAGVLAKGLADLKPAWQTNEEYLVMFVSVRESLTEKIDKLREAIDRDDTDEIAKCAFQVFSESTEMSGGTSPTESIINAIYDIIHSREVNEENIPDIVLKNELYNTLKKDVDNICDFILAMANGDLSKQLILKGYLAGVLKMFQSHLRQLTWQTQMISMGDFTQRVNFMGDFSTSFNLMVEQLEQARKQYTESEKIYRHLAFTDHLTGLANRRHFFEAASSEFYATKQLGTVLSIIMIDIDHFKKVNDDYGHNVGDIVLQSVAQHLQKAMRGSDILGRYGGEEFIVLLPETNVQMAQQVAERIRRTIQTSDFLVDASLIKITVSLGMSCFDSAVDECPDVSGVIDRADKALYDAKNAGRNLVVVG